MKKRVVFYAHNLEIGGIEKALVTLLKNIYTKYDITLILEENKGVLLNEIPNNIKIKEYKISNNKNIILRKILNRLKLIFHIVLNFHRYDFSCLYVPYSIPGSILMRYYSKNNSIWIHTNYYEFYMQNEEPFKNFFNNRKIEKFKNIFIISNEAKDSFINIYPDLKEKLIVCGNLIDNEKILKLSKEKIDLKKGSKTIYLNVSRHEEKSKKLTRLIKASKLLSKENDNFEVWMIGDGEDNSKYKELVKKEKLDDKIKFLGMKKNPYPYFNKADAIILTSDYEGFPVVYLEALVLNTPIITTIKTSNSYFDISDYALICDKDEKSIFSAMKEIKKKQKNLNINKYNQYTLKTITKVMDVK